MPITVAMIESKEFKIKRLNGYDPEDVDMFLDDICDQMIEMQEEINRLNMQLKSQPAVAAAVPAPNPYAYQQQDAAPVPPPYAEPRKEAPVAHDNSEAAQKLLARAQKVYDDTIAEAKKEAETILSGARAHAGNGLEDLEKERDAIQEEIDMLKSAARDYRSRFLRLVQDQQHVLNTEKALFDEE